MSQRKAYMVAIIVIATITVADSTSHNLTDRLRQKLLKNYDKMARPISSNNNGTTTVHFDIRVLGVWIEEDHQIWNLNTWTTFMWNDPRLTWDYKDYDRLSRLNFGDHELWQPDITLYNNADSTAVDHYGNVHAVVFSNGVVYWIPPATYRVECPLDLTYWPYDTQLCTLLIGSWTTDGWEIDLQLYYNQTDISGSEFSKGSYMWQFVSGTIKRLETYYPCCPEPYLNMKVQIKVSRISPMYTMTIVIPALAVSLVTLLQFVLPLRETRRLTIGCACCMLTFMMLLYLAWVIPHMSNGCPIIVKFFGQTLIVVIVSVGVNALIIRLGSKQSPGVDSPPPAFIKNILTGPVSSILRLQAYTQKVGRSGGGSSDEEVLENTSHIVSYADEWLLVAAAVQRLAAFTFCALFAISILAYTIRV